MYFDISVRTSRILLSQLAGTRGCVGEREGRWKYDQVICFNIHRCINVIVETNLNETAVKDSGMFEQITAQYQTVRLGDIRKRHFRHFSQILGAVVYRTLDTNARSLEDYAVQAYGESSGAAIQPPANVRKWIRPTSNALESQTIMGRKYVHS